MVILKIFGVLPTHPNTVQHLACRRIDKIYAPASSCGAVKSQLNFKKKPHISYLQHVTEKSAPFP
jgi:hypothetical protein